MPTRDRRFDEERSITPSSVSTPVVPAPRPSPTTPWERVLEAIGGVAEEAQGARAEATRAANEAASAARRAGRIERALGDSLPHIVASRSMGPPPMRPRYPTHGDDAWGDQSQRIELPDPVEAAKKVDDAKELADVRKSRENRMNFAIALAAGVGSLLVEQIIKFLAHGFGGH